MYNRTFTFSPSLSSSSSLSLSFLYIFSLFLWSWWFGLFFFFFWFRFFSFLIFCLQRQNRMKIYKYRWMNDKKRANAIHTSTRCILAKYRRHKMLFTLTQIKWERKINDRKPIQNAMHFCCLLQKSNVNVVLIIAISTDIQQTTNEWKKNLVAIMNTFVAHIMA